ncbi:SpoIIE family protein phosphatase [Desulfurivibrio sp. D14AmB]|uniref:SpoIIE family protein phosphatase n=1 Tax=Desulfurivibrio sp. D14AmB TaxID=3374370 RepID=UPI00376EBB23
MPKIEPTCPCPSPADLPGNGEPGLLPYSAQQILQAIGDGVYVTDRQRKIVYWNRAAERITGWRTREVLGRRCHDDLLCHTDKDGHLLCGKERCPLHRAMVTGTATTSPSLLFLVNREGRRLPVQVNVSPIYDQQGQVIGGVEVFRDYSAEIRDLERAKLIQARSMQLPPNDHPRLGFTAKYLPHGVLGGDYYTVEKLDDQRYAFCIADLMGHGTAAGLYTMHLHSLWESNRHLLTQPATLVEAINHTLCSLLRDGESFATGLFGLIDLKDQAAHLCAAGSPSFILHRRGEPRLIKSASLPLGLLADHAYQVNRLPLEPGDGLLFYTDGAIEIDNHQQNGEMLGNQGLLALLAQQGFPTDDSALNTLLERLLINSNQIRFPDDLTILAIHYRGTP